jgi:RNA polymerase sigma factor (sigma-70 family)
MGIVRPLSQSLSAKTEEIGALLKALAPGMIRAAHALMGAQHPDVDDVVQQALIGLVQALPSFRGECSHAHFASRIVARTVVTARHRAKVRADRRDDEIDVDAMESGAHSQSELVLAERRRRVVRELLDQLPEEQAETFALRVGMGFSLPEVAAATQVPLNTVRSRVRLAKEALKRRIDADPKLLELLEDA